MLLFMSFMYSRKRTGPRTEPCGTPDVTHVLSDRVPLTETPCFRCGRNDSGSEDFDCHGPCRLQWFFYVKNCKFSGFFLSDNLVYGSDHRSISSLFLVRLRVVTQLYWFPGCQSWASLEVYSSH